jgi:NAD-dependent DNA ligase
MPTWLDPDGQPLNERVNAHRRLERDISEMLGLAKGILADGLVTPNEAELLARWLAAHPDAMETWPTNILASRLQRVFSDGVVSAEEQDDLKDLLSDLVGGRAGIIAGDNAATALPFDRPPPNLLFPDKTFVLTGKFAFGPRTACQRQVAVSGGRCENDVTMRTDYLVIGTFGSRDWVHTSHGRKIEKAVHYRQQGRALFIVSEDHWAASLPPRSA